MRTVSVVIGANYGDEGKGLVTDALSVPRESLVVRFNGGAQAGHTVVTPDGVRHVFHHFGSGTFNDATTFLGPKFVVNPILFFREYDKLKEMGFEPDVLIDYRCPLTTPYDMMLNREVERVRGASRHGSCGLGFNETLQRHAHPEYLLDYRTVLPESGVWGEKAVDTLRSKLELIRRRWVPEREAQLGVKLDRALLENDGILAKYIEDVGRILDLDWTMLSTSMDWLSKYENIVFEGAQGLRLDEDSPDFPHVTHSKTGLTNALAILKEAHLTDPIDAYYVTRPYLTRHGAGPLPSETKTLPYPKIVDATNIPNEFQGTLRFGYLDTARLIRDIAHDLVSNEKGVEINPRLVVTCVDHLPGEDGKERVTLWNEGGRLEHVYLPELAFCVIAECNLKGWLMSRSPARWKNGIRKGAWAD